MSHERIDEFVKSKHRLSSRKTKGERKERRLGVKRKSGEVDSFERCGIQVAVSV